MNPNRKYFQKRLIASVVASSALAGFSGGAFAQQGEPVLEEVVVTGIRSSLERAMDIKRDSDGVVDAISAEDIGKFPDSNLAESLQRITGVSIKRTNGEGSEITVRGFGPANNMITLNGRTMPGAIAYGGSSGADGTTRGGNTRAFDFSNLAAEAVSGVEVYKTGKADIATGGIGATVNIKTNRPLDNPGLRASIGAKALHDTTNRTGDDVTPELSGLMSWTDDSDTFGVSLSASYQERHSGYTGATVNEWHMGEWGIDNLYNRDFDDPVFVNEPEVGQLYTRPNDIRYAFSDTQRERTNAQLTLQFAPTDAITGTVDYTFAQQTIQEERGEVTNWVQNGTFLERVEFNDADVATPIFIAEDYRGSDGTGIRDQGYEQQFRNQENTLDSFGFNVEYQVNDSLSLALDVHDSSMESLPNGPGYTGSISVGLGAPVKRAKTLDYSGDLPTYTHELNDCTHADNNPDKEFVTNCNGELDAGDVSSSVLRNWSAEQTNDITQVKLDGAWEFDNGRFDFGLEMRDMSSNTKQYNGSQNQVLGGWGVDNPGEFPEGMIEPFDVTGEFDDFNTGNSPHVGFRANAYELAKHLVDAPQYADQDPYIGIQNDGRNTLNVNDTIDEETMAGYFQVSLDGSLGDMDTNLLFGLRYETTDVTSTSRVTPTSSFLWVSEDDFFAQTASESVPFSAEGGYDNLLPNLDFRINLTEDLVGRFSTSKTIARPSFGDLSASVGNLGIGGSTLNGAVPTADGANPSLAPLESTNFDLSLEWYYDDASYASAGIFEKRVINFVGTGQTTSNHFGVRNQTAGPRAFEAMDALNDLDEPIDDSTLYTMMVILENPDRFPGGASEYDGTPGQAQALGEGCGEECDIAPNSEDPLMQFRTSVPVNNREAKVYGAEFAVQHFFGDSGFGAQANYTYVNGDVKHDDLANPDEEQFALLGLSDTANVVLMYEDYGVQARLAYNWRDKYLNRTNYKAGNNPGYIETYQQLDLNVSYDVTDDVQVFFEGINLTGEDNREHARNENMLWYLEDLGPRYAVGARYSF
ncbi:TonB-dependent receptor [Marinimicrobium locisalis]|uniref:TonB-dependent receptor n=1 Tax=Marinimicrobium locisalis TaxID=546022 RepID=UPI0032221E87